MKKTTVTRFVALLIAVISLLICAGCGNITAAENEPGFSPDDIALTFNGNVFCCGDDASALIDALGNEYEYSESISCNYAHNGVNGADGMDKFFDYTGVSIATCPMQPGTDNIRSIEVYEGQTLKTAAGIGIGSSRTDVEAIYGTNYIEDGGVLFFYSNPQDPASAQLYFVLENNTVAAFGIA